MMRKFLASTAETLSWMHARPQTHQAAGTKCAQPLVGRSHLSITTKTPAAILCTPRPRWSALEGSSPGPYPRLGLQLLEGRVRFLLGAGLPPTVAPGVCPGLLERSRPPQPRPCSFSSSSLTASLLYSSLPGGSPCPWDRTQTLPPGPPAPYLPALCTSRALRHLEGVPGLPPCAPAHGAVSHRACPHPTPSSLSPPTKCHFSREASDSSNRPGHLVLALKHPRFPPQHQSHVKLGIQCLSPADSEGLRRQSRPVASMAVTLAPPVEWAPRAETKRETSLC